MEYKQLLMDLNRYERVEIKKAKGKSEKIDNNIDDLVPEDSLVEFEYDEHSFDSHLSHDDGLNCQYF